MKIAVIVAWLWGVLSFFVAPESTLSSAGRLVFAFLVVAHAVECVVFLPRLRAAGGSLGHHLVRTFLFGIVHVRGLEPSES